MNNFRLWQEQLEQFVLDVIFERRKDRKAVLMRRFLFSLSKVFEVLVNARLFLYKHRVFREHTLGCQTICIGNLTVGGTGKTPVVEKFAKVLAERGRKVAILSRGYKSAPRPLWQRILDRLMFKGGIRPPKIVSDGHSLLLDSEQAGDEPYMLASNVKNVIVLVDKDRVKSGRFAIEKFGCDTLVLDDGFQYLHLKPKHQILLVDRTNPFGNHYLLPRGTLREPIYNMRRATHIFITKSSGKGGDSLRSTIRKLNPNAEIIECGHKPLYLQDVFSGERRNLDFLENRKVAALSGIALPHSFEHGLKELGASLVHSEQFADHHRFTQQEIIDAINKSHKKGAQAIITTEKDAVRFPKVDRRDVPIYFLRVEIDILTGGNDFEDLVDRICFKQKSAVT